MGNYQPRQSTEVGARKIDQILHRQKICLLNVGTGGGKTYMSIHAIGKIAMQGNGKANVLVITTSKQKDTQAFQESFKSYNEYYHTQLNAFVTNYDQLTAPLHFRDAYDWVKAKPKHSVVMILDEAHYIKNPTSNRSKMVTYISKLPAVAKIIAATATPVSNSLLDGMTYLILAGYYKNKTRFLKQHVRNFDQYHQPIVKDRSGKVDLNCFEDYNLILRRLNSITVKIDTKHLLPKRIGSDVTFQFDRATQHAYRQIQQNWREGVYNSISQAIAEQRRFVALHAKQRLVYLAKVIKSPKRPQTPIFIFYQYKEDLQVLTAFLQKNFPEYHLRFINGQTKRGINQSVKPKSDQTIVLAQYQAAGEAINAPWSSLTIFYGPAQSAEKYQQAKGRNRRAMQTGDVYQIRFIVKNTISDHMWHYIIDNKEKFTKELEQKMIEIED